MYIVGDYSHFLFVKSPKCGPHLIKFSVNSFSAFFLRQMQDTTANCALVYTT